MSEGASWSKVAKIRPRYVSTRALCNPRVLLSSVPSYVWRLGTPKSRPSMPNCHPWYGHVSVVAFPQSTLQIRVARCEHELTSTWTEPSFVRDTITGSSPMYDVTKSPGLGICDS